MKLSNVVAVVLVVWMTVTKLTAGADDSAAAKGHGSFDEDGYGNWLGEQSLDRAEV
jgi:hypothetical protein